MLNADRFLLRYCDYLFAIVAKVRYLPTGTPGTRGPMFLNNITLLLIFVVGVIAFIIGMGFRDRNPGFVLMGIGFLATLFAVVRKAIELFG